MQRGPLKACQAGSTRVHKKHGSSNRKDKNLLFKK